MKSPTEDTNENLVRGCIFLFIGTIFVAMSIAVALQGLVEIIKLLQNGTC